MSSRDAAAALERLQAEHRVERVPADRDAAGRLLDTCGRHLHTAARVADEDPTGAYALLYDAARKAVAAHLLAYGWRLTGAPGSHVALAEYAQTALREHVPGGHLRNLQRMRRTRNATEYDARDLTAGEVEADLAHARAVVEGVARAIGAPGGAEAARAAGKA